MTYVFWLSVAWLSYVYVGYPVVLWILGRIRRVRPRTDSTFLPAVSVLLAARNEEQDIGWKIDETLKWNYPGEKLEVLVASDASDDRTDEIVQGIMDPRVTLIRMESRSGKNIALNRLASQARGELLLFTDANSHLGPDCLRKITAHFADARVGCVTGETRSPGDAAPSVIEKGATVYGGYESLIKRLEGAIGSVLVCDGAVFCIRASLFSSLTPEFANDLELPFRIGALGYWILHEPEAIVYEADTRSPRESFDQRRRISAQGMLAMRKLQGVLHGRRRWQFVSRKFLRWLTLVPLLLIAVASVALASKPWMAVMVALQALFYCLALAGWMMNRRGRDAGALFSAPFYTLLGSAATLMGVVDALRGRRFAVWEIPALSRGRTTSS